jgi:NhaP-type Na+/H+ or K+/H+ antiporter
MIVGGPAFGLACGILSVIVLNRINNELEVEITITFGLAYLVFYVADVELGVSAVLALVTMGLYMSKHKYCISSNVQPSLASAWRITTYFVNILIFTVTCIIYYTSHWTCINDYYFVSIDGTYWCTFIMERLYYLSMEWFTR